MAYNFTKVEVVITQIAAGTLLMRVVCDNMVLYETYVHNRECAVDQLETLKSVLADVLKGKIMGDC